LNDTKTYEVVAHFKRYEITQAQVDACTRIVDMETRSASYRVASATTPGVLYTVRYDRRFGRIACNCPAWNYPTCWHRRAAVVAEREYKKALLVHQEAARRLQQEMAEEAAYKQSPEYHLDQARYAAEQSHSYMAELEKLARGGDEAAKRERRALKKYGLKAYTDDGEGFNLRK
jgi:hypothetical protein